MCEYEMGETINVSNNTIKDKWRKRIFIKHGRDGSVICVNDNCVSNYETGESFFTTKWPCHSKIQLITNEVKEKLKQAIKDGKELKFRIDSEEQSKELQEFLFECGFSWNGGGVCNTNAYCLVIKQAYKCIGFDTNEEAFNSFDRLEFNLKTGEIVKLEKEWVDYEIVWDGNEANINLQDDIEFELSINRFPLFCPINDYMFIGYVFEGDLKDKDAHCHPVIINDNKIVEKATHARFIKVK